MNGGFSSLLSLVGVLKDKCGYFSPYLVPQLSFKTFPYRLCSCGKTCDSSEIKLFLTCRWILSVIRVTVNWKWQIDSTLLGSFSSGLFILKQLKPGQSDQIQNSTKSSLRERYWGLQQMGLHPLPPSPPSEMEKDHIDTMADAHLSPLTSQKPWLLQTIPHPLLFQ